LFVKLPFSAVVDSDPVISSNSVDVEREEERKGGFPQRLRRTQSEREEVAREREVKTRTLVVVSQVYEW